MLIAQISDLHISALGVKTLGIAPMSENLKLCVKHINQLATRPDIVLVTGDISNNGDIDELINAKNILNILNIPYFVIPGNHDNRQDLLTIFGEKSCQMNSDQLIQYTINDYDVHFIAIDSTIPNQSGGEFSHKSDQWLRKQLLKAHNKPTILFMHHPPINLGISETNIEGFDGKKRLANIVKTHTNIEAILCGHIHLSAHTRWHGSIINTAPSIGMRLVIDFSMEQESQYILDDPSYQLHYWTKEQNLITFDVNVNDTKQGHPFY